MKNWFTAFFLLTAAGLSAQFGINGGYRLNNAEQWKLAWFSKPSDEQLVLGNGPALGIDYWFRLKNLRIEFLPELNGGKYTAALPALQAESDITQLSFFFNTQFYFMDIKGDCDCPTFSKKGPPLSKGVFFQVSPGISYWLLDYTLPEGKTIDAKSFAFSIGAGIGLDIGLSDLLTLSPVVGLRYTPSVNWEGLRDANNGIEEWEIGDEKSGILQTHLGLRIGLRLDH